MAGDTVDQANAALAFSSCNDCQTVAISIQALLYFGDPNVVTPENLAIAINQDCSFFATLATAYQFALEFSGPVHFTPEGSQRIAAIRRELHALRHGDLSIQQIQARVDGLMDEFLDVLVNESVTAPAHGGSNPSPTPTTEEPAVTASPTASPTPTPEATTSPEVTPTTTPEPTPSAEPTP